MLNKIIIISLFVFLQSNVSGQNIYLCFEPIKHDIENGEWEKIDDHLDEMHAQYADSIIVPFTLNRIGNELFEIQDLDKIYKYSKLMLEYDSNKSKTKFPESSDQKWEWYCKYLATQRIYYWGHFYLASAYLHRKQYDSCLLHLDSSFIQNYTSLPRRYTYNVSAGIQLTMMRSICLEGKEQYEEARKILLPYLFLDNFDEVPNYYNHCDIVNQYFKLIEKSNGDSISNFSPTNIFTINKKIMEENKRWKKHELSPPTEYSDSNDSIALPSGWRQFQGSPEGNYIRVEDVYVPIAVDYYYYLRLEENMKFSLDEYLKTTEFYSQYFQRKDF